MSGEHAITTVEQLREVVPEATAKTQTKVRR